MSSTTATAAWFAPLAADPRLEGLRRALDAGEVASIHGVTGPARLLVAILLTGRPLLVVVARENDVEQTAEDLRTLAQEVGAAGSVLPFPAPGPAPFRGLPRHADAALRRAAAIHAGLSQRRNESGAADLATSLRDVGAQRRNESGAASNAASRRAAGGGTLRAWVASPAGLLRPVLQPRLFETRVVTISAGDEMTPEILLEVLDEGGYRREDPVGSPGEVARRGGILDVFPPDRDTPVRMEFLGDTVETLRSFDPETQRTTAALDTLEILPLTDVFAPRSVLEALRRTLPERFAGHRDLPALLEKIDRGALVVDDLADLLPLVPGATVAPWTVLQSWTTVMLEPERVAAEAEAFHARAREERERRPDALALEPAEALVPAEDLAARTAEGPSLHVREVDFDLRGVHLPSRPVRRYAGDLRALSSDLGRIEGTAVLFLGTPGRAERLRDVLREDGLAVGPGTAVDVRVGVLGAGFELPAAGLTVLADGDIFPEEVHLHRGRGSRARSFLSDFRDLKIGDLVVHQDHGIGRFEGLETLEVGGLRREFMVLAYQGGDKLKVPVETFDRVQKYASAEGARPIVDKLGSGAWEKTKKRVKKAMRDMAAELLKLYAERKARPGHAFTGESPWQREFEESFEYDETRDQEAAITDVMADMSDDAPMDRLVCGDVGYGKTEVAMRAAMRAVLDGKQVAVLAPTTILAFQHWKTFRKRFAPFPVTVEMVSRFRTAKELKQVLAGAASGQADILIGTHRLLSRDVAFRDLGLLVIDEEQRFGVAAKETLKHLRTSVDCLTLSATPIPRTLQMGLAGIRDMSVIETPPKDRLAIQTAIVKFSTDVIATAIRQELAREGQVYFVHNRVESIYSLAGLVQKLAPEARVAVAHGQMPEAELERSMLAFVEGRADVLVATTIIENGLDIPRANTMIINRADRYGLAQLYQLRGRIGRSDRRAYAFLMVPPDTVLSEAARKRLAAIREFSELGAGFRIAALDLELRGAGNLLGGEQSGHIEAVGLDLYVKLLEQTILELKGQEPQDRPRATFNLRVDLRIPEGYVPEAHQRMALYKRVSQVRAVAEVDALRAETRDRYGALPAEVDGLLAFAALRIRSEMLGVQQADLGATAVHLRLGPGTPLGGETLARIPAALPGAALTPQGVLRIPILAASRPLAVVDEIVSALEALVASADPE